MRGVRFKAYPTAQQKLVLSQWMGCARLIWNAKCAEEEYYQTFARKYYPIGTFAPIDQTYSQFKSKELTPFLSDCPSQVLRNSAVNWYDTFQHFMKGLCGKPKLKSKSDKGSIHITSELFKLEPGSDGNTRLFIGSKTNNIGYLSFKAHRNYKPPRSLYITKQAGHYFVSFSYVQVSKNHTIKPDEAAHLQHLKTKSERYLEHWSLGIDRGVVTAVQAGDLVLNPTRQQTRSIEKQGQKIKQLQKKLARQTNKQSHRRFKTKQRLSRAYSKVSSIRKDFCHQASHQLIQSKTRIFILEDLKTSNMTRSAKGTVQHPGKSVKAKSGLNRAILSKGWHQFESYLQYKALEKGKVVFKIAPHFTSQACAVCDHTHPDNRKTQSQFECLRCGHRDNADRNACQVIKKKAIGFIKHSGTELVGKGIPVLTTTGRGDAERNGDSVTTAINEASKKKVKRSREYSAA